MNLEWTFLGVVYYFSIDYLMHYDYVCVILIIMYVYGKNKAIIIIIDVNWSPV